LHHFCALLLLILSGCEAREEAPAVRETRRISSFESRSEPSAGDVDLLLATDALESVGVSARLAGAGYAQAEQNVAEKLPIQNRMVIKTTTLNCEVANYDEALIQAQKIATQFGGFVVSSSTQINAEEVKSGSIKLRIDAKNFDAALQALKQLAQKVESESVLGNDVTEEFYDLTARLENKRKAEKRYQEILASAKTTKDILEVEVALTDVRQEIERMEGRKRFLEDQVALSTINVNLHEPYPLMASGQYGFLAKMRRGIEAGISGFSDVLSACITFVIAGIPIFVLLYLAVWIFKRYRRRAKAAQLAKAAMAEKKE